MTRDNSSLQPFRRLRYSLESAAEDLHVDQRHLRYCVDHGMLSVVRDGAGIYITHHEFCRLEASDSLRKHRRRRKRCRSSNKRETAQ
jgi:hypothetical protein